MMEFLSTT